MKEYIKPPDDMSDIYSKEKLEYLSQYKIRNKILKILKDNFKVEEIIVISEKEDEKVVKN